jgi:excisionase family DNA binding protein
MTTNLKNQSSLRTKPESAAELRISQRHLENLIAARAIAVVRIGRCVRIEQSEIERLKRALTVEAIS